jgi:hypothetical protein
VSLPHISDTKSTGECSTEIECTTK